MRLLGGEVPDGGHRPVLLELPHGILDAGGNAEERWSGCGPNSFH